MSRAMQILFVLAFAVTSLIGAPLAVCQHADAKAHAAALASNDASEVKAAQLEESAEAASEKRVPAAEVASAAFAPMMLPNAYSATPRLLAETNGWFADPPAKLASRSISPLLDPPLD